MGVFGGRVICAAALALMLCARASADPAEEAAAAHDRGDFSAEVRILRPLAENGDRAAQTALGLAYEVGQGVTLDDAIAASWYLKAAEQGEAKAQFRLCGLFEHGAGVEKNDAQAFDWCQKAAIQGDPLAQVRLGNLYQTGRGAPASSQEAALWFQKAADQGDASGQFNLGVSRERGSGMVQDYVQAASWYAKAADQGMPEALANLGTLYAQGHGVARDYLQAYVRFSLAASMMSGDELKMVVEDRDNSAATLAPAQLDQAKREIADWIQRHAVANETYEMRGSPPPAGLADLTLPDGRLGVVAAASREMVFLELEHIGVDGPAIVATAYGVWDPPIPVGPYQAVQSVSRMRFDCAGHKSVRLGMLAYDAGGRLVMWLPADPPQDTVQASQASALASVLCQHASPPNVFNGHESAMAFALQTLASRPAK